MNGAASVAIDPAESLYLAELARHSNINEVIAVGNSPVQRFYENAVVFVTGGTGFLGKHLIEKLLRSCKIQKIYLLLRSWKEKSLKERVDYMVRDELYDYLREKQPDFINKLIPVAGDITKNQLGLSDDHWTILTEEVNVIFHVAATINFLEPLKLATLTNVRGTREMLNLAKACKNLKSFVHVSTAYAHATPERVQQTVLEEFYETPISPELLIELAEQLDDEIVNDITPRLLKSWPNTYAFTKAVAEEVVRTMGKDLPICIVRPAIVVQAHRELPGWADRSTMNNSVVGFIVGIILGGLHVMLSKKQTYLDLVPVDVVNNAVITAAHDTAAMRTRGETDIKIYTGRCRRGIRLCDQIKTLETEKMRSMVSPKILWFPYVIQTDNIFLFFLLSWLLHFIPGYLVDKILVWTGNKAQIIRLFDKAYKQNKVYGFYLCNDWNFDDSNLLKLSQNLDPADSIIFSCDLATCHNEHITMNNVLGFRKYILRDRLQNTEYARKKFFWLRIINVIYLAVYTYILWKIIYLFYRMSNFVLSLAFDS